MKIALATLLVAVSALAWADDRLEYNRRAADSDRAAFIQLDLDRDGKLTRDEVRADLHFGPRFDDMDTNRDGVVTAEEMQRYLEKTYGAKFAEK